MSFGIYAQGHKATVLKRLEESKGYGDTHQHDLLREMLKEIIERAPDTAHVSVQCSGHHDYSGNQPAGQQIGNVTLTLTIAAG